MWLTIGHDKAVQALAHSLSEGRLAHAYLLVGPPQVGKMTLATDLARAVNCLADEKPCGQCGQCKRISQGLHADVRVVSMETGSEGDGRSRVAISIDQVRDVQRTVGMKPYEGRYRVIVFDGAEHLSQEAANSLLKTLEEPPEQVMLVLLASDTSALLPTVVSRCHLLELRPLSLELIARELEGRFNISSDEAKEIARLSGGRIGWALQTAGEPHLLEDRGQRLAALEEAVRGGLEQRFSYAAHLIRSLSSSREAAVQEMALWLGWWRDVLVIKQGAPELVTNLSRMDILAATAGTLSSAQVFGAVRAVQDASSYVEYNANLRLTLEEVMLALPRPASRPRSPS